MKVKKTDPFPDLDPGVFFVHVYGDEIEQILDPTSLFGIVESSDFCKPGQVETRFQVSITCSSGTFPFKIRLAGEQILEIGSIYLLTPTVERYNVTYKLGERVDQIRRKGRITWFRANDGAGLVFEKQTFNTFGLNSLSDGVEPESRGKLAKGKTISYRLEYRNPAFIATQIRLE